MVLGSSIPVSVLLLMAITDFIRRIYWAAMAFTGVAIITSLFIKDVTENMTDNVAVILENDHGKEKSKEAEL
jgi:type II secretory pathway component PulF